VDTARILREASNTGNTLTICTTISFSTLLIVYSSIRKIAFQMLLLAIRSTEIKFSYQFNHTVGENFHFSFPNFSLVTTFYQTETCLTPDISVLQQVII
jgi:hypothetical protein